MANIIQAPRLEVGNGRLLPVERSGDNKDIAAPCAIQAEEKLDLAYMERLTAERDALLQRAEQAEATLHQLQTELTEAKIKASAEGYQVGLGKAQEEAHIAQAKNDEAISALLQNLKNEQRQLIHKAEDAAIEIGFAATAKLIGKPQTDPALVESLVRQAISQVLDREGLLVWLSPADCQHMQQLASSQNRDWADIEFKVDDNIQLGGCRIDSRCGSLDARLELQMQALKEVLIRTRGKSAVGVDR